MINLHLGDCMEAMAKMKDKQYDLAIVDPPYGETCKLSGGRASKDGYADYWDKVSEGDHWNIAPPKEYFEELFRVSKNQIIWGANHYPQHLKPSSGWVFWDKGQRDFSFSDGELAYTSFIVKQSVFTLPRSAIHKENRFHPTQKPVALYKWLLSKYAKPGQTILDTHLGSGSIAIACHDLGYSLDGWELDPDYYKGATDRLKLHQAQGTLFDPVEITRPTEGVLF